MKVKFRLEQSFRNSIIRNQKPNFTCLQLPESRQVIGAELQKAEKETHVQTGAELYGNSASNGAVPQQFYSPRDKGNRLADPWHLPQFSSFLQDPTADFHSFLNP